MKYHDALKIIRTVAREPAFVEIERDEVAGELVFVLTDMRWDTTPMIELFFENGGLHLQLHNNGQVGSLTWTDAEKFNLVDFHLLFKTLIILYCVVSPTHGATGLTAHRRQVSEAEVIAQDLAAITAERMKVRTVHSDGTWTVTQAEDVLNASTALREVQDAYA